MGSAPLRIVVATGRPGVVAFFEYISRQSANGIAARVVGLSPESVTDDASAVATASVAVIDASVDPPAALELCGELRVLRDDLPIAALFCCARSATADRLRSFLAAGIGSFLDLQLSVDQTVDALRGVARGDGVLHLQLTSSSQAALLAGTTDDELSDDERELLHLVSLGLTDDEIGARMCLSRHTIKHRIDRLRQRVGARNRVRLAALAGHLDRDPPP